MAGQLPRKRRQFGAGSWIWWVRPDGSRAGPAQVWMLILSAGRRWAYVELEGHGIWVGEERVTDVVPGSGRPRSADPSHGSA